MKSTLQAYFSPVADATEKQLVRQVASLKAENEILRRKLPKQITVTAAERERLIMLDKAVGSALCRVFMRNPFRPKAGRILSQTLDQATQEESV